MIILSPCEKTGLNRNAYGKVLHVDMDAKVITLKSVTVWVDEDGKEWKREEHIFVSSDNDIVDYEDTEEVGEDGNPIRKPIRGFEWWYNRPIVGETLGEAIKSIVDEFLAQKLR